MAQSARESRKTPLSIEPFWERPTSGRPTTNQMGEMENSTKTSDSRSREYNYRHIATTQTIDSSPASGTEVRDAD